MASYRLDQRDLCTAPGSEDNDAGWLSVPVRFLGLTLINPLTVIYVPSIVRADQTATTPTDAIANVAKVALASAS